MKTNNKRTISMMALSLSVITLIGIGGSTVFGAVRQEENKAAAVLQIAAAMAEETVEWNTAKTVSIELNGNTVSVNGAEVTDKAVSAVSFDGTTLSISQAGTYVLTGELTGNVAVSSSKKEEVVLVLNGVTVACEEDEALTVKKTGQLTLVLADGTENVLSSGSETQITDTSAEDAADASGGAVHLKSDTVITGNGSLTVNGYINNGIQCSKTLTISSGTISIHAVHHGIKSKDTVTINGGEISILSGNDGIHTEQEAAEASEEVVDAETGEVITQAQEATEEAGTFIMNGGILSIDSYGDAIQAYLDLTVNDGILDLKTEGEYDSSAKGDSFRDFGGFGRQGGQSQGGQAWDFDQTDDTVSEKGLKSDGTLSIQGGIITIDTVDDAIHCADLLEINGGEMTISTGDDGIHSDTQIDIHDGTITILTSYEGIEANQINVSGGTIDLTASDDGFNANGGSDSFGGRGGPGGSSGNNNASDTDSEMPNLNISGGNIYVNASGDGLDSNGNITVTGGVTVVDGPANSSNGAVDAGMENGGVVTISDGTVFAWGASGMAESFGNTSTQASFLCTLPGTCAAGTQVTVADADGNELFSHTVASAGNSLVFSCPELTEGETCQLIIDETVYELTLSGINTTVRASADGTTTAGNSQDGMSGGGQGGGMPAGGQGGGMPTDGQSGGMPAGGQNGEMPTSGRDSN